MKDYSDIKSIDNVPVVFGLRAQGHIKTIEKMLTDGKTWGEIGKEIGWCPVTAKEYYHQETKAGEK